MEKVTALDGAKIADAVYRFDPDVRHRGQVMLML